MNDQCRITPSPPKEKKREKEKKRIFFFYFPRTSESDLTQQIDCQEYLFDDHVKTIMITPPIKSERESPRRRSLKCQVCDWLVVKGSKDTYILTSLNDGPLRSLMLPFVMKQPIATATICSQRMNDAISLLQFHSDCSFFLSFLRP